jgi:hypothetical protein
VADPATSSGGPVRPLVALGLATVSFIALLIFGLGMASLLLGAAIVEEPGLGQVPGIFATSLTIAVFALALWWGLRRPQPPYAAVLWTALAAYAAYLTGMWVGILVASEEFATAGAVAGRIATSAFGLVVAGAAALAAWGGIALARTRTQRPRWPWEDEFDE